MMAEIGPAPAGPQVMGDVSSDGPCSFSSALSRAAFMRMSEQVGQERALSSQALDLATARSEFHDIDPIGVYRLKVQRTVYRDKSTDQIVSEETLVSNDFGGEPIGVWTDAGEYGTGSKEEYKAILSRASKLAQTKGEATMFWVSPGKDNSSGLPAHRAYLWEKDANGEVTAYSYQLTGSQDALFKTLQNLSEGTSLFDSHSVIWQGDKSGITHKRVFDAHQSSLTPVERESSREFLDRFRRETETSDSVRWERVVSLQKQNEQRLREAYKGDIKSAVESVAQGFFKAVSSNKAADFSSESESQEVVVPVLYNSRRRRFRLKRRTVMEAEIYKHYRSSEKKIDNRKAFKVVDKRVERDVLIKPVVHKSENKFVEKKIRPLTRLVQKIIGEKIDFSIFTKNIIKRKKEAPNIKSSSSPKDMIDGLVHSHFPTAKQKEGLTRQSEETENLKASRLDVHLEIEDKAIEKATREKIADEMVIWQEIITQAAPFIPMIPDEFSDKSELALPLPLSMEQKRGAVFVSEVKDSLFVAQASGVYDGNQETPHFIKESLTPKPESIFQEGFRIIQVFMPEFRRKEEMSGFKVEAGVIKKIDIKIVEVGREMIKLLYTEGELLFQNESDETKKESYQESIFRLAIFLKTYFDEDTNEEVQSLLAALIYREIKKLPFEIIASRNPEFRQLITRFESLSKYSSLLEDRLERLIIGINEALSYLYGVNIDLDREYILDNILLIFFQLPPHTFEKLVNLGKINMNTGNSKKQKNSKTNPSFPRQKVIYYYPYSYLRGGEYM